MKWNDEKDALLCREILFIKPYQFKSGSKESGNAWSLIATNLNAAKENEFLVTQKSVRDRYKLLLTKHKRKMREQEGASGSNEEETELDNLLENIKEESEVCLESQNSFDAAKKRQENEDANKAEEIRVTAMESLSQTMKRKNSEEAGTKSTKRNCGTETLTYLREKYEVESKIRREELELKKAELNVQQQMLQQQMAQQQALQQQIIQQGQITNAILARMCPK